MSDPVSTDERFDFAAIMRQLYCATSMYETLAFPLRVQRDYFRTLFRRRVMWVRNWQATPMIAENQAKWVLTYERRRFFRWIPVQAAVVDTLDECIALVKHRRAAPVKLGVDETGATVAGMTWNLNFNCKVDGNASDELRPKGADHGATAAGGAGEVSAQPPEAARDWEAESSAATEDASRPHSKDRSPEETAGEVAGDSASVLEGRER